MTHKPNTTHCPTDLRPKFEEYCREGEHQDGEDYWDNFETIVDVIQDFMLYIGSESSQLFEELKRAFLPTPNQLADSHKDIFRNHDTSVPESILSFAKFVLHCEVECITPEELLDTEFMCDRVDVWLEE